jgi:hypothetical protein
MLTSRFETNLSCLHFVFAFSVGDEWRIIAGTHEFA